MAKISTWVNLVKKVSKKMKVVKERLHLKHCTESVIPPKSQNRKLNINMVYFIGPDM